MKWCVLISYSLCLKRIVLDRSRIIKWKTTKVNFTYCLLIIIYSEKSGLNQWASPFFIKHIWSVNITMLIFCQVHVQISCFLFCFLYEMWRKDCSKSTSNPVAYVRNDIRIKAKCLNRQPKRKRIDAWWHW